MSARSDAHDSEEDGGQPVASDGKIVPESMPSAPRAAASALFRLSSLHYWITAILLILLLPLSALAHLRFCPAHRTDSIVRGHGRQGDCAGRDPPRHGDAAPETVASFRAQPARLLMLAVLPAVFVAILGWSTGLTLGLAAVAVAEFLHHTPTGRLRRIGACVVPGLYLLLGITLIWYYNDIIVSFRWFTAYDPAFTRIDSWFGISVPGISKWAVGVFSPRVLAVSEVIYYGMFVVLGAGLFLIGLQAGLERAMRFVGAALLAYYVALACFVVFPSLGPFMLCADHAGTFPNALQTYAYQVAMMTRASGLYRHGSTVAATGGYFISFPCMHVVKPTLVWWYLRHKRRVAFLLGGYLVLLTISIVLLEWHYISDIVAGFVMAAAAIRISDRAS